MPYPYAHAAKLDQNNVVQQIVVIPYLDDDDAKITEYCNSLGLEGTYRDTSYLGKRRGKYAAIGDSYDPGTNQFITPAPPVEEES